MLNFFPSYTLGHSSSLSWEAFAFLRTAANDEWRIKITEISFEMQNAELHEFTWWESVTTLFHSQVSEVGGGGVETQNKVQPFCRWQLLPIHKQPVKSYFDPGDEIF